MKAIYFVMSLIVPGGELPPYREPMETLEACQAKVAKALADFKDADENFAYVAGCQIVSKKADPA